MPLIIDEPSYPAVGIDFGTTNSLIAVLENDTINILKDKGVALIPSVVHYGDINTVGDTAIQQNDAINTIYSVKRVITEATVLNTTPIECGSLIFSKLKSILEANRPYPPNAVVTVPAYFDEKQRQAIKQSAELSGINVIRLLNEPTAAAIGYNIKNNGIYLVYDLGGGTFDISVLEIKNGIFRILAVNGDTELGGDDFDIEIANYIANKHSFEICDELINIARNIKESLSTQTVVNITYKRVNIEIHQSELSILLPMIERTLTLIKLALRDANVSKNAISDIILVGGSSKLSLIYEMLSEFFNKKPLNYVNPQEAVVIGAAIYAHQLSGFDDKYLLLDVNPISLGIETLGGVVEKIILRNTPIPISYTQEFTTFYDNQSSITIHVLQGEDILVDKCRSLHKFNIDIPKLKAGTVRILVTFQLDENNILTININNGNNGQNLKTIELDKIL